MRGLLGGHGAGDTGCVPLWDCARCSRGRLGEWETPASGLVCRVCVYGNLRLYEVPRVTVLHSKTREMLFQALFVWLLHRQVT